MTALPMITSAAPAKASAKATNTEASNQDTQGFGNVLARQVADADKPTKATDATSPSPSNAGKASNPEESTETSVSTDSTATMPADMLAALLAQPGTAAAPQQGTVTAPVINNQAQTNTPLSGDTVAAENPLLGTNAEGKAVPAPLAGLSAAANKLPSLQNIANVPIEAANNPGKQFADQLKISDAKELSTSSGASTVRGNIANELTSPTAPVGVMPLLASASTTAINQMQVNTPVTQAAWGEEFSQKITWLTTQKNQSAELHLNPPQLGPLDVVIKVNGDQATAMFSSPHAAVREAIEQALPKLREMMADSGIMLGNAMVSDQTSKNEQHAASPKAQNKNSNATDSGIEASAPQEVRVSSLSRHNGMVDTFA